MSAVQQETLYDLRWHKHFGVVDRRTDRVIYSAHGPKAFESACEYASEATTTGYLSVVPILDGWGRYAR